MLFAGTTLAWLVLSVLMALQDATAGTWLRAWVLTIPRWVPGLLLTLMVFALARAAPVGAKDWKRPLAVHAGAAVGLTLLGVTLQQGLLRALRPDHAPHVLFWDGVRAVLRQRGVLFLMIYAGLVGVYRAFDSPSTDAAGDESESEEEETAPNRISVRTGDAIVPVPIADIEWIEAADSYVRLHLTNGDAHLHRSSMTAMTDRLADRPFLRVHRSTIVRIDAVERLETPSAAGHYEMVLRDGTRRRVSDRYRDDLLGALGAPS
jgi:two-component system LytT family response regulator